jgi:hypothetical protein
VKSPPIQLQDIDTLAECLGKSVQKPLKAFCIDMRKLEEKMFPCGRFNGSI